MLIIPVILSHAAIIVTLMMALFGIVLKAMLGKHERWVTLFRTESPGRPPRLPHSSSTLIIEFSPFSPYTQSLLAGKGLANSDRTSPGSIGLETEFNNDTDEKQTYTFQFEKVRTATVEVSYQRGFSIGSKANFSIGLPKVLGDGSIGVEMDKRLEVGDVVCHWRELPQVSFLSRQKFC